MALADIVIVALVATAVILALRFRFGRRAKGGCAGCSEAGSCSSASTGTCPVSSMMVDAADKAARRQFEHVDKGDRGGGGCCH